MEAMLADLSRLERDLGLPQGFIWRLVGEDDWSFIIKSHAVIEATLTHLITSSSDQHLHQFFASLSLDGRISKVRVAREINALDAPVINLISQLARIRNGLVHDIRHLVEFDLQRYIMAMQPGERDALARLIVRCISGDERDELVPPARQALEEQPRLTLGITVLAILGRMLFRIDPHEYERAIEAARQIREANPILLLLAIAVIVVAAGSRGEGNVPAA